MTPTAAEVDQFELWQNIVIDLEIHVQDCRDAVRRLEAGALVALRRARRDLLRAQLHLDCLTTHVEHV
jgi:hypothetical protein